MNQIKQIIAVIVISFLTLSCAQTSTTTDANEKFMLLVEKQQAYQQTLDPFVKENNLLVQDISAQALAAENEKLTEFYQQFEAIDNAQLSEQNQINRELMLYRLKNAIDSYKYKAHYMPLTAEAGFHAYLGYYRYRSAFNSVADYQLYLERLVALEGYFAQQMQWMEKGIETGITQPKVVLAGFEESISAFISEDASKSEFYQPFLKFPDHISEEQQQQLTEQAQKVIIEHVNPMYQRYYDFMVERYIPNAKQTIAAKDYPDGEAFYQNRAKHYTTLDLTADEIHEIGLKEVARIRGEMEQVIEQVGFKGSFAEFTEFLRTDPQFYATTPEQLLKEASYISKKMDGKLPALFKTLPRTPYGVEPVPMSIAPKYTTGRYKGSSSPTQAGFYWVNTYALDRRPLYVLEALTLHEAVPGHHLQISLASEMENVPAFRNNTYISAFGEGWGLYAEYLGLEAGFYQDPYSNFGRLTYEMWRAVRLVVDTGMHVKGWSRDQAMDYLASNSALSMHNVRTEIDRYISWPGQALSYKLGEITIKKLRAKAEKELAENFDIREFHHQVLKNGSIPLSTLEKVIDQYIKAEKARVVN